MSFDPKRMKTLRGDALPSTHLDRYDLAANTRGVKRVLHVACPYCNAAYGRQCLTGS